MVTSNQAKFSGFLSVGRDQANCWHIILMPIGGTASNTAGAAFDDFEKVKSMLRDFGISEAKLSPSLNNQMLEVIGVDISVLQKWKLMQ